MSFGVVALDEMLTVRTKSCRHKALNLEDASVWLLHDQFQQCASAYPATKMTPHAAAKVREDTMLSAEGASGWERIGCDTPFVLTEAAA